MAEQHEIKDLDGNLYSFAHVGDYLWLNRNLMVTRFNCGTKLNLAKSFEEWENFLDEGQPAYCYYDFDEKNKDLFGALYNKYVLYNEDDTLSKDIALKGCSIPNDFVVQELIREIGVKECAAFIKSKNMWHISPHNNKTGLEIVPSGYLNGFIQEFESLGSNATFGMLGGRSIFSVIDENNYISMNSLDYSFGFSLRCVKRASFTSKLIFEESEPEIPLREQIDIEFFNGLSCLNSLKRNNLFDLMAVLLITTPTDIRKMYIDYIDTVFKKRPFDVLQLDMQKRVFFIVENQLDNNVILKQLADFNENLTEDEAIFISFFIHRYLFPYHKINSFDLTDSNNFLMILSIVNKMKKFYMRGNFPLFLNAKDKIIIQDIISLMSLK
jgi:uncharacterized protein (TIGR02145 family)